MNQPTVYRATQWGEPVAVRPELNEKIPAHADMLRYDLAFCNPNDPSIVVFPVFKSTKAGRTTSNIAARRWSSFSVSLAEESVWTWLEQKGVPLAQWITYIHPDGNFGLEPQTFDQFLAANRELKLAGWRTL